MSRKVPASIDRIAKNLGGVKDDEAMAIVAGVRAIYDFEDEATAKKADLQIRNAGSTALRVLNSVMVGGPIKSGPNKAWNSVHNPV
jgi:hypothetical protein